MPIYPTQTVASFIGQSAAQQQASSEQKSARLSFEKRALKRDVSACAQKTFSRTNRFSRKPCSSVFSRFPDLRIIDMDSAFSFKNNGIAVRLPAHSDRIAQDLHLIPFYPRAHLRAALKTDMMLFKSKNRMRRTLRSVHPVLSQITLKPYHPKTEEFDTRSSGRYSDSASTPRTPSQLKPVVNIRSSTSQQRLCRRITLRSLFIHTYTI